MKWARVLGAMAVPIGAIAALALGIVAFACTPLPNVTTSSDEVVAGGHVELTGFMWVTGVPVQVHWDTLSGPVVGQGIPAAQGYLGPVTVNVPANAEPGYHILIATDSLGSSYTSRVPVQVLSTDASGPRAPQAVLATGGTVSTPVGANAGVIALLAVLGLSGLLISATSVASLVRTRQRVPVPTSVPTGTITKP